MKIRYHCDIELDYVAADRSTFILNIQPALTARQQISDETLSISGAPPIERWTDASANRFLRFEAGPGPVAVRYGARVALELLVRDPEGLVEHAASRLPADTLPYVLPSRYCESDKLMAFAQAQFGAMLPGYDRIAAIAGWVRDSIAFSPGASTWTTSAADTLQTRAGVCRDFAHVMIALCRSLNVPARFVTGIDYGADPALGPLDFHAYVEVLVGDRWYLFDPSGISPTTALMRIGTGRDAADVAFATIFGTVTTDVPRVACVAIVRPSEGLEEPDFTDQAVASSERHHGLAARATAVDPRATHP
jgi:transglutaminase-like putative cysteine protease